MQLRQEAQAVPRGTEQCAARMLLHLRHLMCVSQFRAVIELVAFDSSYSCLLSSLCLVSVEPNIEVLSETLQRASRSKALRRTEEGTSSGACFGTSNLSRSFGCRADAGVS